MTDSFLSLGLKMFLAAVLLICPAVVLAVERPAAPAEVPILLYHRFGPVAADSMTVTTPVFESHLAFLRKNGYTVIPLRQLIDYYLRKGPQPPRKAIVIVADDGHKTVYSEMLPLIRKYHVPVTLFLYPSAISNASYAMTWRQIRELKETGLFDLQGHTYWHPNFKIEKKRLKPGDFEKLVEMQMKRSREKIERETGTRVDLLARAFGIFDDYLTTKASEAGYVAAFTIEARHAGPAENMLRLPRYLLSNADNGKTFERLLEGGHLRKKG
jgi:peptidoglycan/xylan/chitin deacetylase (PgdA/CDA1 family)